MNFARKMKLNIKAPKFLRKLQKGIGKINIFLWIRSNKNCLWTKVDSGVVEYLQKSIPGSPIGALLSEENGLPASISGRNNNLFKTSTLLSICEQVRFLTSILDKVNPERILETGTHKSMFCYVAHLHNPSVKIDTFGNLPESQNSVDFLNKKFEHYIKFYLGDSRETLSRFSTNSEINFAWVDGGHTFDVCMSDLVNCARLNIKNIAVDDYIRKKEVHDAVHIFIKQNKYRIISKTNRALDGRGIVFLKKQ